MFSYSLPITEDEENTFTELVKFYSSYILNNSVNYSSTYSTELKLWKIKSQRIGKIPKI